MAKNDRAQSQGYWKIIRRFGSRVASYQKRVKRHGRTLESVSSVPLELSLAVCQATLANAQSNLSRYLFQPNASTASKAALITRAASTAADQVTSMGQHSSASPQGSASSAQVSTGASARSSSLPYHPSTATSPNQPSLSVSDVSFRSSRATSSNSLATTSSFLTAQSLEMTSIINSLLPEKRSESEATSHPSKVTPIKVSYYDVVNKKWIKTGSVSGKFGQVVNVTVQVRIPTGYQLSPHQKVYYVITAKSQAAKIDVVPLTIHPIQHSASSSLERWAKKHFVASLNAIGDHIHSEASISSDSEAESSQSASATDPKIEAALDRFLKRYVQIKHDLFGYSSAALNRNQRVKRFATDEIVKIERLIPTQRGTVALLSDGNYIPAGHGDVRTLNDGD